MSLSVNEIMVIVSAIGVLGIGLLIRELFGKCAEETAEAIEESFDEKREEWNK